HPADRGRVRRAVECPVRWPPAQRQAREQKADIDRPQRVDLPPPRGDQALEREDRPQTPAQLHGGHLPDDTDRTPSDESSLTPSRRAGGLSSPTGLGSRAGKPDLREDLRCPRQILGSEAWVDKPRESMLPHDTDSLPRLGRVLPPW